MHRSLFLALALVSCSPAPRPQQQPASVVSVPPSSPSDPQSTEPAGVEEAAPMSDRASGPASDNPRVQAEAAFRQARGLFAEGRYAEACPLFEESIRYDPAVGSYLNLGRCRELEGNVPAACQAFGEALRMSPTGDRANFTVQAMQKLGCGAP